MLTLTGWKLGKNAIKSLSRNPRAIAARDLVQDMGQKGVDMRIGLDIAWLSIKRIVDSVVLVTGDSDFVPVMKFAGNEGIRVYLEALSHGVRRELKVHADIVL
ncbi:MAG: NYN domain-containing protein [bacterium]|nr:NYN domain-containing protein [bacterium]